MYQIGTVNRDSHHLERLKSGAACTHVTPHPTVTVSLLLFGIGRATCESISVTISRLRTFGGWRAYAADFLFRKDAPASQFAVGRARKPSAGFMRFKEAPPAGRGRHPVGSSSQSRGP